MSISKIKNIIIVLLAALNLFFLFYYIWGSIGTLSSRLETNRNLSEIMLRGGVSLSVDIIPKDAELREAAISADPSGEDTIVRSVLGTTEKTSEGGIISRYTGEKGEARFNTSGEFEFNITDSSFLLISSDSSGTLRAVEKLLDGMPFATTKPHITETNGDAVTITSVCAFNKTEIYNCELRFYFEGEALTRIEGRYPTGIHDTISKRSNVSVSTALLALLESIKNNETEATAITAIQSEYRLNIDAFGVGLLSPGWLITADSGEFFIDSATLSIEKVNN